MSTASDPFRFAKLCCGGNDFIVADCRSQALPANPTDFVRAICHRREGAGADGIIFLMPDEEFAFRTLLYNSDGSKAEVSYNGSRCVGLFARRSAIAEGNVFSMNSDAGRVEIAVQGRNVILGVPPPQAPELHLSLPIEQEEVAAHFVVAGVPYVVLYVDDLASPWVARVPPGLRVHERFPDGTNVAVARLDGTNIIHARFFERGVEEETPSSGSGSVALATVTAALHGLDSPVIVRCDGGDFAIHFDKSGDSITNVRTAGEVHFIFEGVVPGDFAGLR